MDQIEQFVEPMKQFSKDSIRLVKRCTKPDRKGKKEFKSLRKKNEKQGYQIEQVQFNVCDRTSRGK